MIPAQNVHITGDSRRNPQTESEDKARAMQQKQQGEAESWAGVTGTSYRVFGKRDGGST